jgi:type VI secretion system protein ImpL
VTWPSGAASGSASLSLVPEMPGRDSALKFEGPWALKRLLDKATITANGANAEARFVIGGRDVAYTIQTGSGANLFLLPALSGFSCPKAF